VRNLITCIYSDEFIKEFPVISLRDKKIFIIQSDELSTIKYLDKTLVLVRYPILFLIVKKIHQIGWSTLIRRILNLAYYQNMNYKKIYEILNLSILNEVNELDIYSTNSAMGKFNSVFHYAKRNRKYVTNVIYYAEPLVPVWHQSGEIYFEYEDFKNNIGDLHWVWTSDYAGSLTKNNNKIIVKPVGSIMFKTRNLGEIKKKKNQIVIFDVSPKKHIRKTTFYQMDLITKFFDDILNAKNEIRKLENFELILKPKGTLGSNHLNSYLKLLDRLQEESNLRVIDPDTNPYPLIAESALIISIPFTSIALIGKEVNTKSIYYYPFLNAVHHPKPDREVPLICGINNLERYLRDNV
jgi:polysaccharide biosynthesis PFTS motif protein